MNYRLLLVFLALGLCTAARAEESSEPSRVSLVGPGGSKSPVSRDQFVLLVVEGPYLSYDRNPIPEGGVVDYVNNLLKTKDVSYIGVHPRVGVKYGDVVQAIDTLRKTTAKNIGISMVEIAAGVNP